MFVAAFAFLASKETLGGPVADLRPVSSSQSSQSQQQSSSGAASGWAEPIETGI